MFFTIKLYLHLNCVLILNWIVLNRTIFIKMDLALICHKTPTARQHCHLYLYMYNINVYEYLRIKFALNFFLGWGNRSSVMSKVVDRRLEISEFELRSSYYVRFQINTFGKGITPHFNHRYFLNNIIAVLLQR